MVQVAKVAERAIAAAGAEWGVSRDEVLACTRSSKRVAAVRQIAIYITKRVMEDASWSEIGRVFGRDRTTVRHAYNNVARQFWISETLTRLVRECSASAV